MIALAESVLWLRNPYAYLDDALTRKGLTFKTRLPVVGHCLFTGDPGLVAEIEQNRDLIGGRGTRALRPVVGDESMIVLEGAAHEKHRRIFAPPFFAAARTGVDQLTLDWTERILSDLRVGATTSAIEVVTRITLNVIVEVVFGKLAASRHQEIVGLLERWMASFRSPLVLFVRALHLDFGPASPWGRFRRNRQAVERFIGEELRARRADSGAGLLGHALTRMREGEQLDHGELVSETITFLLFGHDTTAAAMAWVLYHLGRDEPARRRVAEEWAAQATTASPQPEALSFTRAAVQESMRLCPVVVHLTRHAVRATKVGPHAVGKDERVLPCAYLAHHNRARFEQPYAFRPERFLADPDFRHAFFPFGFGNRVCAGMPFALRQMLILTGLLVSRMNYELLDPGAVRPVRKMVLIVPSGGTPLRRLG